MTYSSTVDGVFTTSIRIGCIDDERRNVDLRTQLDGGSLVTGEACSILHVSKEDM